MKLLKSDKVVELVGVGSVINGATPSSIFIWERKNILNCSWKVWIRGWTNALGTAAGRWGAE